MKTTREVRDLIWAIHSPSLLVGPDQQDVEQIDPTQVDPDHLAAFLNESPSYRVGRYFERLVLYWLKCIRRVEIVADSFQIRQGNRTIGEIDLLFFDEQRRLTHWEIAVKFYLYFPLESPIGSHFIGPNAADTFERKTERLIEHQLPRSETYFPDVQLRQAFVKGRIFYHPNQASPQELPARLSPDHLCCTWIRSSQCSLISTTEGLSYRILVKPFWLSEESGDANDADLLLRCELIEQLARHFAGNDRPVLISQLSEDGERVVESDRVFVVPDRWPDPV